MSPFEYIKFRTIDEKAIQMLTTGECFYSSPRHFNDPLDCTHSLEDFPVSILDGIRKTLSRQNSDILYELETMIYGKCRRINSGVVSFCGRIASKEVDDPVLSPNLWGHYANNHKGICIGFSPLNNYSTFDFSNALSHKKVENGRQFSVPTQPGGTNLFTHITTRPPAYDNLLSPERGTIVKVEYANKFKLPSPNWATVIDNYKNDTSIINSASSDEILNRLLNNALDIKHVVSNKHKNWNTENEYRLFGSIDKSQSIGAAISSLTFGLSVSDNAVRYLTSIAARFYGPDTVELYKMAINNGELIRIPLDQNDASPESSQSQAKF